MKISSVPKYIACSKSGRLGKGVAVDNYVSLGGAVRLRRPILAWTTWGVAGVANELPLLFTIPC